MLLLSADRYRAVMKMPDASVEPGGQALLLPEILAAIPAGWQVVIPAQSTAMLDFALIQAAHPIFRFDLYTPEVVSGPVPLPPALLNGKPHPTLLYLGTPTLVDGELWDPTPWGPGWCKSTERSVVRHLTFTARELGYKGVLTGLGSGDITRPEREYDMQVPYLLAYKCFGGFEDWLFGKEF